MIVAQSPSFKRQKSKKLSRISPTYHQNSTFLIHQNLTVLAGKSLF
jgi:hypothetical protein